MSGFWESELGEITGNESDAFAKSFKQIPDGTMALAKIEAFKNQENKETGFKYLQIDWILTDGDFKGQKVQQKLKVYGGDSYDKDPARTKHRSLNMFKLLYQLFKMKPRHANAPTDEDLAFFHGKIAGLKIRETEPNDQGKQYNWVSEVHKGEGFKCETGVSIVVTHTKQADMFGEEPIDSAFSRNTAYATKDPKVLDDDIPF